MGTGRPQQDKGGGAAVDRWQRVVGACSSQAPHPHTVAISETMVN